MILILSTPPLRNCLDKGQIYACNEGKIHFQNYFGLTQDSSAHICA